MHETLPEEPSVPSAPAVQNFSFFDASDTLDTSKLNPHQMSLNASSLHAAVDPATLPIQTNEVRALVRMLHFVSEKINNKVSFFKMASLFFPDNIFYPVW